MRGSMASISATAAAKASGPPYHSGGYRRPTTTVSTTFSSLPALGVPVLGVPGSDRTIRNYPHHTHDRRPTMSSESGATETRQFGDIATKLLMENDRVRIWEMRLEPGQKSALHKHDNDYIMIQISGDKMAADFEPDSAGP